MQNRVVAVIAGIAFLATACSTYVPIQGGVAPTNGSVRLLLTDAAHSETFGALGSQVASVDGELRAIGDTSVTIVVSEVIRTSADDDQFHGEPTLIPSRYIRSIERKRTQVARSLLIAGALLGGAIWIGTQGHGNVTFGPHTGTPGSGQ
jgi:hypothetical protein